MSSADEVMDIGNGMGIDTVTLKGIIHDEELFGRWLRRGEDPLGPVIGQLFRGELDSAQAMIDVQAPAAAGSTRFRLRAFQADVLRERGDFEAAIAIYRALLDEESGTRREAVVHQHLGKVYFSAGQWHQAHRCFSSALRLRESADTPADQLASTRLALARVEEVLGDT